MQICNPCGKIKPLQVPRLFRKELLVRAETEHEDQDLGANLRRVHPHSYLSNAVNHAQRLGNLDGLRFC